MPTYIALLRGINVSGKNIIRMVDLKALVEDLGHSEVVTYLQSGNVIFNASKKLGCEEMAISIRASIQKRFQLDIPVLVIEKKNLHQTAENNPFLSKGNADPAHCYVTFLFTVIP